MTQTPPIDLESLGLFARGRGRPKEQVSFSLGAALKPEDAMLEPVPAEVQPLKALRRSHHELAKLIAQGHKNVVISEISGYSLTRIQILKDDPQFKELVEHYTTVEDETHLASRADFHERLAALGFDSIETLHQRLLDEPEAFAVGELLKVVEATADRTGHGKTSTQNLNIQSLTLDARDLADIRNGADPSAPDPARQEDRESLLRLAVRATSALPGRETLPRSEGEGGGLREESGEGTEAPLRGAADVPSVD